MRNHMHKAKGEDRKNRKKFIFIPAILLLIPLGFVAYFLLLNPEDTPEIVIPPNVEAVAVTPVGFFDGLVNPEYVFDELYFPIGLATMGNYLVVADSMADRIQILDMTDGNNQLVGIPGRFGLSYAQSGAFIDGFREYAMFTKPAGVFVTPQGNIIVADTENHAIRQVIGAFVVTIAGNGFPGYNDGRETYAQFNHPRAAVMCPNGYIYVADTLNHAIRRIDSQGYVTLFAGSPGNSGFVDGSIDTARFFEPSGLYITADGTLYVADSANHAIRKIQNGTVTTIAGRPGEQIRFSDYFEGGYVDGSNSEALFNFPRDLAMLPDGSLLVADSLNHAIRKITQDQTITILGGGMAGHFHDSAENLQITRPEGIAVTDTSIFVSDTANNAVLEIPLNDRVLAGRPSREQMLADTGLTTNSRFAFRGDIRVFLGDERVNMGRVEPWIRGDSIFVPIRPFMEALGAQVHLNEATGNLAILVGDTRTDLQRDSDYFIMRGVMVTTLDELIRLFPYTIEWFPELRLITLYVPQDLRGYE